MPRGRGNLLSPAPLFSQSRALPSSRPTSSTSSPPEDRTQALRAKRALSRCPRTSQAPTALIVILKTKKARPVRDELPLALPPLFRCSLQANKPAPKRPSIYVPSYAFLVTAESRLGLLTPRRRSASLLGDDFRLRPERRLSAHRRLSGERTQKRTRSLQRIYRLFEIY